VELAVSKMARPFWLAHLEYHPQNGTAREPYLRKIPLGAGIGHVEANLQLNGCSFCDRLRIDIKVRSQDPGRTVSLFPAQPIVETHLVMEIGALLQLWGASKIIGQAIWNARDLLRFHDIMDQE